MSNSNSENIAFNNSEGNSNSENIAFNNSEGNSQNSQNSENNSQNNSQNNSENSENKSSPNIPQQQAAPIQFEGIIPYPIPITVPYITVPSPGSQSASYSAAYTRSYPECYTDAYKRAYTVAFNSFVAPQVGYREYVPTLDKSSNNSDTSGNNVDTSGNNLDTDNADNTDNAENDDSENISDQRGGYSHDTVEPDPEDNREPEDELVEPPLEDFM